MVTTLMTGYLEGFLVGSLGTLAVVLVFLYYYRKEIRQRKRDGSIGNRPEAGSKRTQRKALRECRIYGCIIFLVFAGTYCWITPIMPYSGKIEKKEHRTRARTILATTYYIYVDGERYTVDRCIHDRVQPGDVIHHPLASQCYCIGGKPHMAAEFAWSTGFCTGVLGMVLIVLCVGASIF